MKQETNGKKPLVLIAEDQIVNQKVYSVLLDKFGYDYILANDGQDALNKVQEREPSLVFMDIQMPGMNGFEAAKNLRQRGFKKPIIAVTASEHPDEIKACLDAGMDEVLNKPLKRASLESILQRWIGPTGGNPTAPAQEESGDLMPDAIFDAREMLDTFMNDAEIALPLLSRFIERTRTQLESIPLLLKEGDWKDAHREAHTIRGAALTMGGKELGKAAARLELACKNTDQDGMDAAYPPLCEAFLGFKKAAEEFIRLRG